MVPVIVDALVERWKPLVEPLALVPLNLNKSLSYKVEPCELEDKPKETIKQQTMRYNVMGNMDRQEKGGAYKNVKTLIFKLNNKDKQRMIKYLQKQLGTA